MFKKHRGVFSRTITGPESGLEPGESYTLSLRIPTAVQFDQPVVEQVGGEIRTNGVVAGWEGVLDSETGQPLEFSPAHLAEFMDDAPIRGAVLGEIRKLYIEALSGELLRKNSKAPPSTGPAAAPPAPAAAATPPSGSAA
jgi:hypothetical protein